MQKVTVQTSSEKYDVLIGGGLLEKSGQIISQYFGTPTLALVADDRVYELYGQALEKRLRQEGFKLCSFVFPHGEASKNLETFTNLCESLAQNQLTGSDMILALGGGVTGDLAGFAASAYLRGIGFIQMPTTLLAAVDSSVGGKMGVNIKAGKNLVGAFKQPALVLCDTNTLASLPPEVRADGLAEIIKYGMISDRELFDFMKKGPALESELENIIKRCVEIKAAVVQADEFDQGQRQILNFGHTLGHALEKISDYKISHGHAVAIGMVLVTRAAQSLGLTEENTLGNLTECLKKYSLPTQSPYTAQELAKPALRDKKRRGDTINLIVTPSIGQARGHKVKADELESFIERGLEK